MQNKTWNYRVVTYKYSYKKVFGDDHALSNNRDEQLFKIVSVYYELKDGGEIEAVSYGEPSGGILDGFEDLSELEFTIDKVQEATKKPILDLDNWPNVYEPKKIKK